MKRATSQNQGAPTVFLAHSSGDKVYVRDFYRLLKLDGFAPWLDEENLVPGQDWEFEVREALKRADAIVVFLSSRAMDNAGYIHKEIRVALEAAERLPEGSISLIPLKLDDCNVPHTLRHLHWLDFYRTRWYPTQIKFASYYPSYLDALREFSTGSQYLRLQLALRVRAGGSESVLFDGMAKGWYDTTIRRTGEQEQAIEYLVRGRHRGDHSYYGTASMRVRANEVFLRTNVGVEVYEYKGLIDGIRVCVTGTHDVEYWMSDDSNLLVGTWGEGGLEELIPARGRPSGNA